MSENDVQALNDEINALVERIQGLRDGTDDDVQPMMEAAQQGGVAHGSFRFNLRQRRILKGHYGKIYAMHWASDSRRLLSASQDGRLIVWNALTTHKVYAIALKSSWVMTCAYSPSGHLVACGGLDNVCSIYKLPAQAEYQPNAGLKPDELSQHEGYLSCCRFVGDDKILTSSGDATCILWDVQTKMATSIFQDHQGDVMSIAPYEGKGIFVSGSCDASAKVWDFRVRNACQATLQGHESDINSVAMFPTGNTFASGSDDSTCRLFDIRAIAQLNRYHDEKILCGVTACDFSHTGRALFAGYDDERAVGWDTLTGKLIQEFDRNNGHSNRVSCLQVAPEGSAVATGSWDMFLKIWA